MHQNVQVPGNVPRPDYAETGQPFSEIESRQQSIGGHRLSLATISRCRRFLAFPLPAN